MGFFDSFKNNLEKDVIYIGLLRAMMAIDGNISIEERKKLGEFVYNKISKKRAQKAINYLEKNKLTGNEIINKAKLLSAKEKLALLEELGGMASADGKIDLNEGQLLITLCDALGFKISKLLNQLERDHGLTREKLLEGLGINYNDHNDNDNVIDPKELNIYSAVGCDIDYEVDGDSPEKTNLDICVFQMELRNYYVDIKEIKNDVYVVEDSIGESHSGTLEELVELQNNGEEIFSISEIDEVVFAYDGVIQDEPPTKNEAIHIKWGTEDFFSSKDKALKCIEERLIEAKNNQTKYYSTKKYKDDLNKSIINENGENIIYDGLFTDKFNKVSGEIEGVYEKYSDGKLFSVCNYLNGLKNGIEKSLNSENILVPFAHYKEGRKILSYSYYPSGGYLDTIEDFENKCELKFNFMGSVTFKDKTINKLAEVSFHKTAPKNIFEHIKEVNNIFMGPRGNIVSVGTIKEVSDREKEDIIKKIKDFECFHPNGNLIDKRSFLNGKINGKWEIFDENGILRFESHHKNGQRNGEQIEYYLNGQIHLKSNWINDVQQGLATTYYENGNKMKESNILDGNYEGDQTEWWENGKVKAKRKYTNDELISEEMYSEN